MAISVGMNAGIMNQSPSLSSPSTVGSATVALAFGNSDDVGDHDDAADLAEGNISSASSARANMLQKFNMSRDLEGDVVDIVSALTLIVFYVANHLSYTCYIQLSATQTRYYPSAQDLVVYFSKEPWHPPHCKS